MPVVRREDAWLITKAILAMRGINQKKHKEAHSQGLLKMLKRPMDYKGIAHAWLRNQSNMSMQSN